MRKLRGTGPGSVEDVTAADWIEVFPGLTLPVASTAHLVALKVLARGDRTRPHDRIDLVALLGAATPADLGPRSR